MRVMLSPEEQAIVEATLACANVKRPRSWDEMRRIIGRHLPNAQLGRWSFSLGHDEDSEAISAIMDRRKPRTEGVLQVLDYRSGTKDSKILGRIALRHHHQKLRNALADVARSGQRVQASTTAWVERNLSESASMRPEFRDGKLVYTWKTETLAGLFAYGTALILDKRRGLASRLGQCGYCSRFNLTLEGRPRIHCNKAHRLAYDRMMAAERMRAYRRRKKKATEPRNRVTVSAGR